MAAAGYRLEMAEAAKTRICIRSNNYQRYYGRRRWSLFLSYRWGGNDPRCGARREPQPKLLCPRTPNALSMRSRRIIT